MTSDVLTFDNLPLSSLNFETGSECRDPDGIFCEINCTTSHGPLGDTIGMPPRASPSACVAPKPIN